MPRDRRRLRDIMVHSLPYAGAMVLSILAASSLISNIHAVAASPPRSSGSSSYLYDTVETFPVMDHGLRGHDFTKSKSPKIVEFYDPKCGACRAFKSNYAETARRVLARRPDVEIYGVSCEAHPDVCSRYAGGKSVPRIFAFPNGGGGGGGGRGGRGGGESDPGNGIEVPKGAGTVHFLSERLIKALRDTGEIASDAARLELSESSETTKRLLRARRFDEGSDDQDAHEDATAEEGVERDASEEDREEETHENDEDEEPEDREGSHEDDEGGLDRIDAPPPTAEDRASDDDDRDGDSESERGTKSMALENISGDGVSEEQKRLEKRMRLGQVQRQQERQPQQDQQQQQREKRQQQQPKQLEPKQEQQPKRPVHKQQQQQQQHQMQKQQPKQQEQLQQMQILQPKHQEQKQTNQQLKQIVIHGDSEEKHSGSQDRRGAPDDGQEQSEDQDSDTQQIVIEQTDAYKNTKEHFDRLDIQHGTESGHHFEKYKKARAAFKESQSVRGSLPVEGATSQKVDVVDDQQKPKNAPGPVGSVNAQSRTVSIPLPGGSKVEDQDNDWGGEFVSEGKYAPKVIDTDLVQSVKFREYVARRKEMLERKEKMKHPINALLGKVGANKESGVTAVSSPMKNYKAQFNMTDQSRQIKLPDLRPEAQQKSLGKKILKKIPIVKRVFKRSKGEETLIDASLSFTRGLMSGLYKTTSLTYKQKAALLDWFDLLSVSLPPEIGLHELIDTLKHNVDEISERQENLKLIIDKHPLPEKDWSLSCRKGTKPYFCGFWKLLHIMSVGFAEQAGGLALRESSPSIRIFSAKQAANVVREYIALFFPCAECSKYFVAKYDDCSFQRCHRLSDETVDASGESWQEFPLWLWEVHNDVSSYKLKKEVAKFDAFGRKDEAHQWERDMKVLFPQMDHCNGCITSDGTWNLNAVYNHLEYEYWTFGHEVHPKVDQFLEYNAVERDSGQFKWVYYLMLVFVILVMARLTLAKKLRVRVTGRHKKDDTLSFGRFPRNKFRDS